jgi:maltooligosyltrehalose trehalohydrolase
MGWDRAVVPDPQDPATFERSKLDWSELEGGRHAVLLDVYRRLASLRRTVPELTDPSFAGLIATADEESRLFTLRRGRLLLAVNFGADPVAVPDTGELLFTTPTPAVAGDDGIDLPPHAGVLIRLGPRFRS